ncbi:FMN reductase [Micromonospora sp. NPDC049679]|uniref:FMN reductase n=1 Tax=Micromonospora sp. NPDC049679 TaxID=3155920 RepID=UPI0033FE0D2E
MTNRTLAVVTAGLSQPSATRLLADRLAAATERASRDLGVTLDVTIIELRDHAHDLTDNLLTGFPSPALGAAIDTVVRADGLIAVTPIFTGSYSGLFKTFFDVLGKDALVGKPVLIAATAGTARHSLALDHALRPMFAYLRALVVPTGVFAAAEDWGTGDGASSRGLADRIDRAGGELSALIAAREQPAPADPFDNPTPFDQLLSGG